MLRAVFWEWFVYQIIKGIQSKCFSYFCKKFLTDFFAKSNFSCGFAYIITLSKNTFGQNRVFWFRRYGVSGRGYNRRIVEKTPFWVLLTLNNKNSKSILLCSLYYLFNIIIWESKSISTPLPNPGYAYARTKKPNNKFPTCK